jgi:hypothetical protein
MIFTVLGILSGVIFILGDIPYLSDTLKARIKPQRVTWGVVFLLNVIGFANQHASGADNSLWLFGAAVFMTGAIFLASLKNGVGGYAPLDIFSIVTSLVGIALWQVFDSPMLSVIANICIATAALVPTFIKTRKNPETENGIAWLAGTLSALLAAVSVGKLELVLLLLPISSALLQAYMIYLVYVRSRPESKAQF